MTNSYGVLSV